MLVNIVWTLPFWLHKLITRGTGWCLVMTMETGKPDHLIWSRTYPLEEPCQQVCSTL